jgi:cation diffusion facilitator family transporter
VQVSGYLKLSIAVAVATIALKTGAWWLTGSVGLLADAMESVVNLAGAIFALAMVTVAAQPADDEHPFGHHKAEYFSSGFEGVLIFAAALAIIWAAVDRLLAPQPPWTRRCCSRSMPCSPASRTPRRCASTT